MLRKVGAVAVGLVGGALLWIVGELVVHGVCAVPVLKLFWCTVIPPGTSVQKELDWSDWLALPIVMGTGVAALWGVWVKGKNWLD